MRELLTSKFMLFHRWECHYGYPSVTTKTLFPKYCSAAKLLQSCPTLCDPREGSPPGSPVPGILQARTLEWVAISFSNVWKWKVKVKSLSPVRLLATPWTAAYQAPPSMGFSRQEYCLLNTVPDGTSIRLYSVIISPRDFSPCYLWHLMASPASTTQTAQSHLILRVSSSCLCYAPIPLPLSLLRCLLNLVPSFGLALFYPQNQNFIMDCVGYNNITEFPASTTSNSKNYYVTVLNTERSQKPLFWCWNPFIIWSWCLFLAL